MERYNNELYHHGIPGMKWGVRRYQNKDGTLTPAGKKKAAKMKEEYTALTGKRLIRKPTPKSSTQNNSTNEVKKKRIKDMSDQEIKDMISRLDSERKLAGLQAETASTGDKFKRSLVNDVVAPAAREAGKELMKTALLKIGKNALGWDKQHADAGEEILKELRRENETLDLKKKIRINKDYLDKKAKEDAEARRKEAESRPVEAEFVKAKKVKDKSTNPFGSKNTRVYDVEEPSTALVPYKKPKK